MDLNGAKNQKDGADMDKKEIEKIVNGLVETDSLCNYCKYEDGCPGGVTCYGCGPSYPPCADYGEYEYFDIDRYLEDQESEDK